MYLIQIGRYYDDKPFDYALARTLRDAAAWLRGQGYRKRPNDAYGVRAYFEHDDKWQWARVVSVPVVGGNEP